MGIHGRPRCELTTSSQTHSQSLEHFRRVQPTAACFNPVGIQKVIYLFLGGNSGLVSMYFDCTVGEIPKSKCPNVLGVRLVSLLSSATCQLPLQKEGHRCTPGPVSYLPVKISQIPTPRGLNAALDFSWLDIWFTETCSQAHI